MPGTRLADEVHPVHASPPADTLNTFAPGQWWRPQFPSPEGLELAAQLFDARPAWAGEEGPRPRLIVSAGSFAITAPDLARRERTHERAVLARQNTADQAAGYLVRADLAAKNPTRRALGVAPVEIRWMDAVPSVDPSREITSWSRKSRANMVRALCELDYRPLLNEPGRVPAMVTLTYPGDWLTVAPEGAAAKRHLQMLRKRWIKAWGHDLVAVWKLEFQRRGAPHFHVLTVPPHGHARIPGSRARASAWVGAGLPFRQWLSLVWADIVAHPDPEERRHHQAAGTNVKFSEGLRMTDPKRVAVYFTKHGSFRAKEYQNCVPEPWQAPGKGPGRFWGYWRLERVTVAVEVTDEQAVKAARIVRRWSRAQGTTRQLTVRRTPGGTVKQAGPGGAKEVLYADTLVQGLAGAQLVESAVPTRLRNVRRRVCRMKSGKGFVSVNNGQTFAVALARALSLP